MHQKKKTTTIDLGRLIAELKITTPRKADSRACRIYVRQVMRERESASQEDALALARAWLLHELSDEEKRRGVSAAYMVGRFHLDHTGLGLYLK